jgi:hypothetical protein
MSRSAIIAIALMAIGCGDAPPSDDAPLPETAEQLPDDSVALGVPQSANPNVPAGAVDPEAEGTVVAVTVAADGLTIEPESVPAGQVTVRAQNTQSEACAVAVRSAAGGLWRSPRVRQNATTSLTMVLSRSPYYVTCELAEGRGALASDTARFVVR